MAACCAAEEVKQDANDEKKQQINNWLPLESNPALLNNFAKRMGMPDNFVWSDVWGFSDELLAFVPQPVLACVLLFPTCREIADYRAKQRAEIEKEGQYLDDLFYVHQYVGNACGTIALCHALANCCAVGPAEGPMKLSEKGSLYEFITENLKLTPAERGRNLIKAKQIARQSDNAASSSVAQTATPIRSAKIAAHFVTFVNVNDSLYELDGVKRIPINHGKTSVKSFLKDTVEIVQQKFMKLVPNNPNFSLMALSMTQEINEIEEKKEE